MTIAVPCHAECDSSDRVTVVDSYKYHPITPRLFASPSDQMSQYFVSFYHTVDTASTTMIGDLKQFTPLISCLRALSADSEPLYQMRDASGMEDLSTVVGVLLAGRTSRNHNNITTTHASAVFLSYPFCLRGFSAKQLKAVTATMPAMCLPSS
jgi:hypothetical protein